MERDALGDRMKGYEFAEDRRLDPLRPIYARIDGRSFSRFTRGMRRPFDPAMTAAMIATASGLVDRTHPRIGYVQSDEISLVWLADDERSQVFFNGRVQKLCSVLASLATALLTRAVMGDERLAAYADRLPHFDARVVQLPSRTEAANMLLWRELDAQKNAISMAARATFSHRQMHGKTGLQMLAMMEAAGDDFGSLPAAFRHGTFLRRETSERTMSEAEREAIPEAHRPAPDATFLRSEVVAVDMPPFATVSNREAVIFDGARPERALAAA